VGGPAAVSDTSPDTVPLKIRRAEEADSAGLARVQVDSYRTAYAGLLPAAYLAQFSYEEQEQDWRDLLGRPMDDVLLVAETGNGLVVGYALGRARPAGEPRHAGELVALHVRREFQRRGIGRRLVSELARALGEDGCTSLVLYVLAGNPASTFYERLGAIPMGDRRWVIDEPDLEVRELAYAWPDIRQAELAQ